MAFHFRCNSCILNIACMSVVPFVNIKFLCVPIHGAPIFVHPWGPIWFLSDVYRHLNANNFPDFMEKFSKLSVLPMSPSLGSKTKDTPQSSDHIGREQNLGPKDFTLESGSKVWKNEVVLLV